MATGYRSPPFFKRGLPPAARATIYLALCFALIVGDLHLRYLDTLRMGLTILSYPLRIAANTPADFLSNASDYFSGLVNLQRENRELREEHLQMSSELMLARQLARENQELRGLLSVSQRIGVASHAAEIAFPSRDPFVRKVILDKGSLKDIEPGAAVVDPYGLLGQVTRVFPLHAEVTLISDKDQTVPVVVERSGLRAVMTGSGSGLLELKFLAANADVRPGDRIVTSGLDGIYAPGLPVAVVLKVERDNGESFARILCKPVAVVERTGAVLVLTRQGDAPQPPPDEEPRSDARRASAGRIRARAVSDAFIATAAASTPVAIQSTPAAASSTTPAAPQSAPATGAGR